MRANLTPSRLDIAKRDEAEIYRLVLGAAAREQAAELANTEAALAFEHGRAVTDAAERIAAARRALELRELAERLFELCGAKRRQLEAAAKRRLAPLAKKSA